VRGQRGFARTSLALSWSPSTDNVGVDRYELARNDALVQVLPSSAASATVALRGNATYALGAPPATAASGRRSRWRSAPALLSVRPFPRGPGDFWPGVPVQAPRAGRGPPHRVTSRTGTGPGRGGVSTRTGSSADGRATVDDRTETESTLVPAPGFEPRPTRV
jgi:hypothetical protein